MLIKKPADIPSSEITPKSLYLNRRKFLAGAAAAGAAAAIAGTSLRELVSPSTAVYADAKIDGIKKSSFSTNETVTPYKDVTNYNNYYEFSTDKYEPAGLAKNFKTRPWTVTIDGAVEKKQVLDVDAIIKMAAPEERIYRHRCVEGWSIVVPWVGFSLSELINKAKPTSKAKFVEFTTIEDPKQMPGQRGRVLDWPYVEGLRMDEAMHPLALLCFGMYGEASAQSGRRSAAHRGSVEVWLQKWQGDCAHSLHRQPTSDHVGRDGSARVRLLCERESECGSSALESGQGTATRRISETSYADVQRLRSSSKLVRRHGLEKEFLSRPRSKVQSAVRSVNTTAVEICHLPLMTERYAGI
jgi:DMSO/TMAO reductase YedYZ molybdopterin-dependent catalytic subunit